MYWTYCLCSPLKTLNFSCVSSQVVSTSRLVGADHPLEIVYFVEGRNGQRMPADQAAYILNRMDVQRAAIILGYRVQGVLAQREYFQIIGRVKWTKFFKKMDFLWGLIQFILQVNCGCNSCVELAGRYKVSKSCDVKWALRENKKGEERSYVNSYIYSIYCGIWFWNCLCFMRWHAWHFSFSLSLTSLCSCWKGGICALRYWEHKLVDCRRRGDSPPCGHHHYFHPILEIVSHRQAGVPARRHDLYSAETEGRLKSFILLFFIFALHLVKLNGQEVELLFLWGHLTQCGWNNSSILGTLWGCLLTQF